MIADNAVRRHLSRLTLARCALRLHELAVLNKRKKKLTTTDRCAARVRTRDQVGRELNMSGREVDRFLAVLKTPPEVQNAFDRSELTLIVADRVARLPEDRQAEVAKAIRDGGKPADAVAGLFEKWRGPRDEYTLGVKTFQRARNSMFAAISAALDGRTYPMEARNSLVNELGEITDKLYRLIASSDPLQESPE